MAYSHNGGSHHLGFAPIGYGQSATSSQPNPSMLGSTISSHSFPMAPSTSAPHVNVHHHHIAQQSTSAPATSAHNHAPPGVTDQDGLIAPPSMPLELDFDNLESASNYMHTYALSQGFDIRIQWSANNQTRICWSCFRGGFPESTNADGTPNAKKRQIPKEKERRKRGSLKIGCPFRVQCTKNWKTGKMELRILEGRHNHHMESDRENLPSQVRRIKSHRKAHDASAPASSNVANASAPTAPSNGVAPAPHLLANTPAASAHPLSMMTPAPPQHEIMDFGSPDLSDAEVDKPSFERNLFNLLGIYDRSEPTSRLAIERDLDAVIARAEAKLSKTSARKRRQPTPEPAAASAPPSAVHLTPTGRSIATLAHSFTAPTAHTAPSTPLRPAAGSIALTPQPAPVRQTPAAPPPPDPTPPAAPPTSGKGSARCSNCKEYGHNRRRCPLG